MKSLRLEPTDSLTSQSLQDKRYRFSLVSTNGAMARERCKLLKQRLYSKYTNATYKSQKPESQQLNFRLENGSHSEDKELCTEMVHSTIAELLNQQGVSFPPIYQGKIQPKSPRGRSLSIHSRIIVLSTEKKPALSPNQQFTNALSPSFRPSGKLMNNFALKKPKPAPKPEESGNTPPIFYATPPQRFQSLTPSLKREAGKSPPRKIAINLARELKSIGVTTET